jgi:hypothetical protein
MVVGEHSTETRKHVMNTLEVLAMRQIQGQNPNLEKKKRIGERFDAANRTRMTWGLRRRRVATIPCP